jgi:hypothetical protein
MESNVLTDEFGGKMAILNTFTTVGPISVCYPRLNSTVPLNSVEMHNPSPTLNGEGLYFMDKTEGLGFGSAVGLLLPEEGEGALIL